MMRAVKMMATLCAGFALGACTTSDLGAGQSAAEGPEDTGETGDQDPNRASVTHSFGQLTLGALEETQPCVSWTLNNDKAVYVNTVTLANGGGWHHSNWFVVPEDLYPGDDGYWDCGSREFQEIEAATAGTVLFAQSTQSWFESQELNPGAVIKVPPRHKVVASAHALNLAPREIETELRMTLEIIHPLDVETVLAPLRYTFFDLSIPPMAESRFSSKCDINFFYEQTTGHPLDIKLHYVLPHYHYLGNYFSLKMWGGDRDGDTIYELNGFNGEANGQAFPTPIDLTGAQGLEFTCGYNNVTSEEVGWGIGDQEMCVMLGLVESEKIIENTVSNNSGVTGVVDDIVEYGGGCTSLSVAKNPAQGPPTAAEIEGEFYVPPSDPADMGLPPVAECEDTPAGASPTIEASLTSLKANVFVPACTFSSCHGSAAAAGLDLNSQSLRADLLAHEVGADTAMPLVDPGNPDNSWIYRLVSECDPRTENGQLRKHMPRNAPVLLEPGLVAAMRDWIVAGAPDN